MDHAIKAEWIDALKSGEYKQGKNKMHDADDFYDPLGVLCDLAYRKGIVKREFLPKIYKGYRYGDASDWQATGLPRAVCEWADITFRDGFKVAMLGDHGKSFERVADWIEVNL